MERENDIQLINSTLSGDDEAFRTLVGNYQKSIHSLAWRKVGDFHIAEEITQDTFLQVYKNLAQLRNPNQFSGWIYVIANRLCIKWLRKNKSEMQSLDVTPPEEIEKSSYTDYVLAQRQTEITEHRHELVKKLLGRLPESERTVVTLHYLGEMTIKEIGKFLGVSANTIKSRLRRGRERLQKQKDELLVRETLGSIQFPAHVTERIMRQVADTNPIATPPVGKPLLPWAAFGTAAVLVLLMLGASNQILARFQKPYSFEAQSEPTIEIIDTPIILNIAAKPAVRNQAGQAATPGKSSGTGTQVSDTTSGSAASEDPVKFSTAQWTQGDGPPGGLVWDIFATSDGTVYGAAPTGLYRLRSDETAWTRIDTSVPINKSLMPMAEHDGTLYIVSTDEVFASDDEGETWRMLGPRPKGRAVGFIITNEVQERSAQSDRTMYLAVRTEGIFRSIDGGTQWQLFNNGVTDKIISAIAAVENTVFAGTESGLYRLDSGTWKKLPVDTSGAVCSFAVSGNNLYVGISADVLVKLHPPVAVIEATQGNRKHSIKILHSADLGASWNDITPDNKYSLTAPPAGITVLAAGETLMALGYAQSRSVDGGQTWTKLGYNQHFLSVATLPVAAVNEKTFYQAGIYGVHRTTDGGESWYPFMKGVTGTRIKDLVAFNNRLYAHAGYEIYQSTDGGTSWTSVQFADEEIRLKVGTNPLFRLRLKVEGNSLYFISPSESSMRILRLSTQDNSPTPIQGVPTFDDEALSSELWIGSSESEENPLPEGSEKSDRSKVELPWSDTRVKAKTAVVSNDVFYVEYKRRLFKWRIGDPEWTNTGLVDTSQPFDEDFYNGFKLAVLGETVYVGKRDGKLFQSLDGGRSWRDVTSSLPLRFAQFKEITFADSTVYVATDEGVLSSQTGEHWRVLTDSAGKRLIIDRFAMNGIKVYGISDGGIYYLDTGSQWKQISSETLGEVISLAVINNRLYSSIDERGIFHISLEEE